MALYAYVANTSKNQANLFTGVFLLLLQLVFLCTSAARLMVLIVGTLFAFSQEI